MLFRRSVSVHNGCFSLFAVATMATLSAILADQTAKGRSTVTMLSRVEEPLLFASEDDGNTALEGFVPDYVKKLGETINQDIKLSVLSGNASLSMGDQTSEMLKQLEQGSVDIVGLLSMTYANERAADFSKPILAYGIVPVARISTVVQDGDDSYNFSWIPLPAEVFLILKPFSAGIWLFTIFCFVGVSVFLYLIYRFNPRERRTNMEVLVDDEELGILSSFLFVFSCLVWQGYTRAPRSISGRILAAFWWTFTVIFLASYTAKLVFYLNPITATSQNQRSSEDPSIQELAARNDITFGVIKNSPDYYFFRQSRIKEYEQIWTKMSSTPDESFVSSSSAGFQRAREGNFVFLVNSLYADYAIGRDPCDLVKVGPQLSSTGMGLAVKSGSPLRDNINLGVLELRENGVTQEIQSTWWQNKCDSTRLASAIAAARAGLRSMTVKEFGGAFILLIIGAVLAGIALLLEILFVRRQKRKEQQPEVKKTEDTVMMDTPAETAKV